MGNFKIVQCRCNHQENPLGLDRIPEFGWRMDSDVPEDIQTSYRILVSGDVGLVEAGIGDMWDSGRIEGDENVSVHYKGKALMPRKRYYFLIMAWNRTGEMAKGKEIGRASCRERV